MTSLQIDVEDSRPVDARCQSDRLRATLIDGRVVETPLWWRPRLAKWSAEERAAVELTALGLNWPLIDEDISIASMLRGQKAPGARRPADAT